ncbi:MAG: T9SS type A sorting domain-containing protein [Chitinophagaceae bacterium]
MLLSFNGNNSNNQLLFYWATTDEKNVNHFELEESKDGILFSTIANIALQTNSSSVHNYHHNINSRLESSTYYRLRIVDNDGKIQYSKIIILKPLHAQNAALRVSPSPFRDVIIIKYHSETTGKLTIILTDVYGREVQKKQYLMIAGLNSIKMDNLSHLDAGTYFFTIVNANNTGRKTIKLLKQ